jgi:hypothetical protein
MHPATLKSTESTEIAEENNKALEPRKNKEIVGIFFMVSASAHSIFGLGGGVNLMQGPSNISTE